jgi:signal transduction histidine kinase/CheY-like chemotaxis protein
VISTGRFLNIRNELVYSVLPLAVGVTLLGGLILLYIFSLNGFPEGVWVWVLAVVAISVSRIASYFSYRRKYLTKDILVQRLYLGLVITNGAIWGVTILFLSHVGLAAKICILLMVVGISAGGLSASVASIKGYFIYLAAILGPLFVWLLGQPELIYKITSVTVPLYILMLMAIAKNFGVQYFKTLELQEKEGILNQQLYETNKDLQTEIAERKRMEFDLIKAKVKAEQANQSKSVFLSHLSHELRTPLNSILGFSELLEHDTNLQSQQRDSIRYIHQAGSHLLDLVNEVLDLATIDSGKLTLNNLQIRFNEIVNECETLMQHLAREKGIKFTIDVDSINDIEIYTDPKRLKQVLINLISNAIKYNSSGGWVKLTAEHDEEKLIVIVEDNGRGISQEKLSDIFSPFDRIGQENSNIEGTGIGLTITKRLVEMMKGQLHVKSREGDGTKFTVILPKSVQDTAAGLESRESQSTDDDKEKNSSEGMILLVEDNLANQMIMSKQLEKLGYRVDCAVNGRLALKCAYHTHYDLIITDCNMPEMDGYEFTKLLRQHEEQTGEHCPVIAITADAYAETAQRCLAVGMDAYLSKPVDLQSLRTVTRKWID